MSTAGGLDGAAWLVARPIAHRGLHDLGRGVVENTAAAAHAAIAASFAIECDVQVTSDGDAVVFHDFTLNRLTGQSGPVASRTSRALQATPYSAGQDRILSLGGLLELIGGRVPLVCEIKSHFDSSMRLADRVAALAAAYQGPIAIKSFDPAIIAHLRDKPPCPLGIVAVATYDDPEWNDLAAAQKTDLAEFLHFGRTRPDFLSYHVGDLPHAVPFLLRQGLGLPVMTWTVRGPEQRSVAEQWADQIVFEGFVP